MDFLKNLNPVVQALIASCFTWGMTALGASIVFLDKELNRKLFDSMLGFTVGVMLAVSYFSLLAPAVTMSCGKNLPVWFPPVIGFTTGSFFVFAIDKFIPHLHPGFLREEAEGIKTNLQHSVLLVLAITLHNIPEGLAIGIAFGSAALSKCSYSFAGAVTLAIGIGIQNLPEGLAVSMPLRREGISRFKSFYYGQLSAVVEPIAALVGALAVTIFQPLLPYALSFAAGAMIYVVIEEVIPESQRAGNTDLVTISTLFGFAIMMILDLAFI